MLGNRSLKYTQEYWAGTFLIGKAEDRVESLAEKGNDQDRRQTESKTKKRQDQVEMNRDLTFARFLLELLFQVI